MASDFIPKSDGQLLLWLQNQLDKIDSHGPGTQTNLPRPMVDKIKAECKARINSINAKNQAENSYRKAVKADKNTTLGNLRKEIGDAKRLDKVTEAVQKTLGWKIRKKEIDPDTAKPLVKVKRVVDNYKFSYNLHAFFTGIVPYRKKPGEDDWVRQREDHSSPWFENEQIPEGTQYRFIYLLNEDEVGQWSDIITIDV